MLIKESDADQVRQAVELRPDELTRLAQLRPEFSIGAVIELGCAWRRWTGVAPAPARLIENWAAQSPALLQTIELLSGQEGNRTPMWAAPKWEIRRVASREDWQDLDASQFQQRFCRSLVEHGHEKKAGTLFSGSLSEVVDNVLQHSTPEVGTPDHGIVGYHVEDRWFSFAVGDTGRGVHAALLSSPSWRHLPSAEAALIAVFKDGASSRPGDTAGDGGLKKLHHALMDRGGWLRCRTGDAALIMDGSTPRREYTQGRSHPLAGVQTTVVASLMGKPESRPLPAD